MNDNEFTKAISDLPSGWQNFLIKAREGELQKDWPAHGFESPHKVTRQLNADASDRGVSDEKRIGRYRTGKAQIDQAKYAVTPEKRLGTGKDWGRHQHDVQPYGGDRAKQTPVPPHEPYGKDYKTEPTKQDMARLPVKPAK